MQHVGTSWLLQHYPHVEYVLDLIQTTVTRDLPEELQTLTRIDRSSREIKETVDLPTAKLNLLLSLLLQNHGKLSQAKRNSAFGELTDSEMLRIEQAFATSFERVPPSGL